MRLAAISLVLAGLVACSTHVVVPECKRPWPMGPWEQPDVYPRIVPSLDRPPILRFSDAFECRVDVVGPVNGCCLACDRILDLGCRAPDFCVGSCAHGHWADAVSSARDGRDVEAAIRRTDSDYRCIRGRP